MPARIVYIQHDCFFLLVGGRTLLFDYPAPNYLPEAAAKVAASRIAGADLTVFASHSHDDHFDPDMAAATATAASRRFVVADDVADLYGDRLPPETVVLEPDDVRQVGDLRVEGLESNDMGLAYRIEADGLSVYFGGDLALWDWPGPRPAGGRGLFQHGPETAEPVRGPRSSWRRWRPGSSCPCILAATPAMSTSSPAGWPVRAPLSSATPGRATSSP